MKTLKFLILLISIPLMFSCGNNSGAEQAKDDVDEATEEVADVFRSEQEELQADLRDAKQEVGQELEDLRGQLANASGEAQANIEKEIEQLEAWSQDLDQKMQKLGETTQDNWAQFKTDVEKTLSEIEQKVDGETEG